MRVVRFYCAKEPILVKKKKCYDHKILTTSNIASVQHICYARIYCELHSCDNCSATRSAVHSVRTRGSCVFSGIPVYPNVLLRFCMRLCSIIIIIIQYYDYCSWYFITRNKLYSKPLLARKNTNMTAHRSRIV